jgi:hypothetical protein
LSSFQKITARGANGALHEFQAYPLGTRFKELPGLYTFCYPRTDGSWFALYIGQTHDLDGRVGSGLETHHRIAEARKAGATHVAVRVFNGRESDRIAAEADLIRHNKPPLNDLGLGGRLYG